MANFLQFLMAMLSENGSYLKRLQVRSPGRISLVPVEEISWIEAADQYVQVHHHEKTVLLRASMNRLERQLNPLQFVRIHRSAIVNVEYILELETGEANKNTLILKNGIHLKVSRRRKTALHRALRLS